MASIWKGGGRGVNACGVSVVQAVRLAVWSRTEASLSRSLSKVTRSTHRPVVDRVRVFARAPRRLLRVKRDESKAPGLARHAIAHHYLRDWAGKRGGRVWARGSRAIAKRSLPTRGPTCSPLPRSIHICQSDPSTCLRGGTRGQSATKSHGNASVTEGACTLWHCFSPCRPAALPPCRPAAAITFVCLP